MSTAQAVLDRLKAFDLKSEGHNKYRCNSPLRVGANSHSFTLVIDDDEHGAWNDFVAGEGGSLYDLATKLGVKLPERAPATPTKRAYTSLAEYAQAHGVDADVFVAAGWNADVVTHKERPALTFKTQTGNRWRFIDGKEGAESYISPYGYQRCWYGLRRAVTMTVDTWQPLVICNGEPSTVVAQHYKVAACAVTGGEKKAIPANLLDELKAMYQGAIIVALDCDKTGRESAAGLVAQLKAAGYTDVSAVDLGLTDGGDLADFCQLYTTEAAGKLFDLSASTAPKKAPVTSAQPRMVKRSDLLKQYEDRVTAPPAGEPILFPLTVLHEFGGMAKVMKPGKLAAVVGVSGTGKTSMLETMVDAWLRMGKNVLIWSPEWNPDEFIDRSIQRYGGSKAEDVYMHEMYMSEQAQGFSKHYGTQLHETVIDKDVQISKDLDMWPGEAVYIDPTMTPERLEVELPSMLKELDDHFHAIVIDYAQLLEAVDETKGGMYKMLQRIKNKVCAQNNLVGLIASQTTKQDARNANKHAELLDASSARFVNDDPFNLFVTLNLEKDETTGQLKKTGILNVTKNSLGRRGKVRVGVNFEFLAWIDAKDKNQVFVEGQ